MRNASPRSPVVRRFAIGYLRTLSFGGYSKHGDDKRALESALDKIFSGPRLTVLVIDVRLSFGRDDRLGLAIASRLANTEYLAYAIQARAGPARTPRVTRIGENTQGVFCDVLDRRLPT